MARAGKDHEVRIGCGKGKDRVLLEKAGTPTATRSPIAVCAEPEPLLAPGRG